MFVFFAKLFSVRFRPGLVPESLTAYFPLALFNPSSLDELVIGFSFKKLGSFRVFNVDIPITAALSVFQLPHSFSSPSYTPSRSPCFCGRKGEIGIQKISPIVFSHPVPWATSG